MEGLMIALWLAFMVVMTAAWVTALISAVSVHDTVWVHAGRGKYATVFLIFITGGFGGIYYLVRIRPLLRYAKAHPPTPSRRTLPTAPPATFAAPTPGSMNDLRP